MVSEVLLCQAGEQCREAGDQLLSISAMERRAETSAQLTELHCIVSVKSSFNDLLLLEEVQKQNGFYHIF